MPGRSPPASSASSDRKPVGVRRAGAPSRLDRSTWIFARDIGPRVDGCAGPELTAPSIPRKPPGRSARAGFGARTAPRKTPVSRAPEAAYDACSHQETGTSMPSAQPFKSELKTGAERYLSQVIVSALTDGWRSPDDFLRHFKPGDLMQRLEKAPELRASILVQAA